MEGVHDAIAQKMSTTIPANIGSPKEDDDVESASQIYEDAGMPDNTYASSGEANIAGKFPKGAKKPKQ